MDAYLKRFSNFVVYIVTLLGVASFIEGVNIFLILLASAIILFAGFTFLIINHISKLEKRIKDIKNKFIRANELIDIKKDIEAFKLLKLIKK